MKQAIPKKIIDRQPQQYSLRVNLQERHALLEKVKKSGLQSPTRWIKAVVIAAVRHEPSEEWLRGYAQGCGVAAAQAREMIENGLKRSEVLQRLEDMGVPAVTSPASVESDSEIASPSSEAGAAVHGGQREAGSEFPPVATGGGSLHETHRNPEEGGEQSPLPVPALTTSGQSIDNQKTVKVPFDGRKIDKGPCWIDDREQPPPSKRSWSEEFAKANDMPEWQRQRHIDGLINGRTFPDGWTEWESDKIIAWMDENWPLGAE